MARGAPDYSNVTAANPLHRLDDMAELAARLGSVDVFDRSGNVIYLETFSGGREQWSDATYGTGAAVAITTERVASPPFSLKMTTGGDGAHGVKVEYEVAYHHLCKMGLEYAFTHHINSEYHRMQFFHHEGETRYEYIVRFDIQNSEVQVYDSDGTYKAFATSVNLKSDAFIFNQAKLVVDVENNAYVRFTFNDETWLLGDYAPYEVAESSVPYLSIYAYFIGDAGSNRDHYIDNVIVTQNEP